MFHISEFAKRTGLTPRTLRFYEDKKLLIPQRDPENQYRIYSPQQIEQAYFIRYLRQLGFGLDEILNLLQLLGQQQPLSVLQQRLQQHLAQLQTELAEQNQQIAAVQSLLQHLNRYEPLSPITLQAIQSLQKKERTLLMTTMIQAFSCQGQRQTNQDFTLSEKRPEGEVYLIADGMGDDNLQPPASQEACHAFLTHLDLKRLTPHTYQAYLETRLQQVNQRLFESTKKSQSPRGSTLSALILKDNQAYIAHIGDCRIYCFEQGQLTQLTQDHSMVQRLLDQGEILEKDIPTHPQRNQIYAILGFENTLKHIQTGVYPVKSQSCFLMVSDGISQTLSRHEISQILGQYPLAQAAERLQNLAETYGEDNASAIGIAIP